MSSLPILEAEEARVFGCLIEKQITTPEYYPLTLNALVNACNQKNNRYPIVFFDEEIVLYALDGLRERKLAAAVAEAGARVPKYKHYAAEGLGLNDAQMAVLCELLLRGAQTPGELRSRAERLFSFSEEVPLTAALDGLAERPEGAMVVRLPLRPGTKEFRYMHLLCGPPSAERHEEESFPTETSAPSASKENRIARLEEEVSRLGRQLLDLQASFETFRRQFE